MDNTKAATCGIDLPTGVLSGDTVLKCILFRELAGPEEDLLASRMSASQKMTSIMANCTLDFGGVTNRGEIKKLIEKLAMTDRWFYLVQLRILSLGSGYITDATCPECGHVGKETIDLRSMGVLNPPDAKNLYTEITLPRTGHKVRWKVADGEADLKIEKMATADNAASVALFSRVTEVDSRPANLADISQLPLADRSTLRKAMEEKEGVFDDKLQLVCKKCSHEYETQMQLDGKSFFSL